jgi:hypothetical protein
VYFFLQRRTAEEDEAGEAGANRPRLNEIVLYFLKRKKLSKNPRPCAVNKYIYIEISQ